MSLANITDITIGTLRDALVESFGPLLAKAGITADETIIMIMLIALAVLGMLHCLVGYRLVRIWVGLFGFWIGFHFIWRFLGRMSINPTTALIISLIAGLALSLVVALVLKVGIFLFTAFIGYGIMDSVLAQYVRYFDDKDTVRIIIAIALGLAVAGLAIYLMRPVLIIVTSLGGGLLLAGSLAVIFNMTAKVDLFYLIGIIVAILGMIFQFSTSTD